MSATKPWNKLRWLKESAELANSFPGLWDTPVNSGETAVPIPTAPLTVEEARAHLGRCFAAAADYCALNGYGAARRDKLTAVAQSKLNQRSGE